MAERNELLKRITIDPKVLAGKPTIRGLRISVEQILRALAAGVSQQELLRDYPELEPEDIQAVLAYAAESIAEEEVYPARPAKPMKLLVDVGIGTAAENWLRGEGHDVLAVRDLDPRMPDEEILKRAVQEQQLVITMDKDYDEGL